MLPTRATTPPPFTQPLFGPNTSRETHSSCGSYSHAQLRAGRHDNEAEVGRQHAPPRLIDAGWPVRAACLARNRSVHLQRESTRHGIRDKGSSFVACSWREKTVGVRPVFTARGYRASPRWHLSNATQPNCCLRGTNCTRAPWCWTTEIVAGLDAPSSSTPDSKIRRFTTSTTNNRDGLDKSVSPHET